MEAKLKEYRALRRRQVIINNVKDKIEKSKEKLVNFIVPETFRNMEEDRKEEEVLLLEKEEIPVPTKTSLIMEECIDATSETSELETIVQENQESWRYFIIKWSIYSVIWITLYIYFLSIQFGAVFFIISILIGICVNTRTRPKKKGEVSAYSVFNQNCASIDGTLDAEQLQRQMIYGIGGIKIF